MPPSPHSLPECHLGQWEVLTLTSGARPLLGPTLISERRESLVRVGASLAVSGDLQPGPGPDIALHSHSADIICRIFPRIFLVNLL